MTAPTTLDAIARMALSIREQADALLMMVHLHLAQQPADPTPVVSPEKLADMREQQQEAPSGPKVFGGSRSTTSAGATDHGEGRPAVAGADGFLHPGPG